MAAPLDQPNLPRFTADLPGSGGTIKQHPDDFVVAELPLYEAAGHGTHVFFEIEKRGLTTPAAIGRIARALQRPTRDVGYAGLKDARARTRQVLSVEHVAPQDVERLTLPGIRVLWSRCHTNKLKIGHLRGNSFDIRIRGATDDGADRARAILERLTTRGVPNYFGAQRFGIGGANARIGRAALREDFDEALRAMLMHPSKADNMEVRRARELLEQGDYAAAARAWPPACREQSAACRALQRFGGDAGRAWHALDPRMRRLFVAALQSELFNAVLARRLDTLDRVELGDLAWKHANGACFRVLDAAAEQPRCADFEISPSGPLFGRKMTAPTERPAALEAEVLAAAELEPATFRSRACARLPGARRPLRVPLGSPCLDGGADAHGPYLRLRFSLPPGSYATTVSDEICKPAAS